MPNHVKKRSSPKRKISNKNWEQFLNKKESRDLLKKVWTSPTPQKDYALKIRQLHKKYNSNKKR